MELLGGGLLRERHLQVRHHHGACRGLPVLPGAAGEEVRPGRRGQRIYATDRQKGGPEALADQAGYETFVVPDDIGGRYSVLTAVGLLPIAVAGMDIRADAGRRPDAGGLHRRDMGRIPPGSMPGPAYQLYRAGKKIEILASYEPSFRFMSEWWKQLYGESEGKGEQGPVPGQRGVHGGPALHGPVYPAGGAPSAGDSGALRPGGAGEHGAPLTPPTATG